MREIVFDTETTGLEARGGDRVTEIGCVEVIDFIPTGNTFHTYINPERDVPPEVVKITGLTREFLSDKPLFADKVDDFLEFVGDAVMVAHNASFDMGFINAELERSRRTIIEEHRFKDTLKMARKMFPGTRNTLDALCNRFDISLESRHVHGALVDAELLAKVYLELNGGREQKLDIFDDGDGMVDAGYIPASYGARPTPLKPRLSEAQITQHRQFIATLGDDAVWNKVLKA